MAEFNYEVVEELCYLKKEDFQMPTMNCEKHHRRIGFCA